MQNVTLHLKPIENLFQQLVEWDYIFASIWCTSRACFRSQNDQSYKTQLGIIHAPVVRTYFSILVSELIFGATGATDGCVKLVEWDYIFASIWCTSCLLPLTKWPKLQNATFSNSFSAWMDIYPLDISFLRS